jgi:hypothetical protein
MQKRKDRKGLKNFLKQKNETALRPLRLCGE